MTSPYEHSKAAAIIYETIADTGLVGGQKNESRLAIEIIEALLEERCINKNGTALTKRQKAKHGK